MKEKFKKFWKEISVFGLVAVVFLALYAYHKIVYVEYSTITTSELTEKMKDKDDFVIVVGSDEDNSTVGFKTEMQTFVEKNRGKKLYYCNLAKQKDSASYIQKTMKTSDGTIPQIFKVKNGKVVNSKSGTSLRYYNLVEMYK